MGGAVTEDGEDVEDEKEGGQYPPNVRSRAALSIWWALRTSVSCLPVNAALVRSPATFQPWLRQCD